MTVHLKPLHQQVILVTGASGELGQTIVHTALESGSKVFLVDENETVLQQMQDAMKSKGFPTAYAVANLSETDQLQVAADHCLATFGTIDTWINAQQGSDTFFWNSVNGSKVAILNLKNSGGVIINLGVAIPGKKDELHEFSENLRLNLKEQKIKVSLSYIASSGKVDFVLLSRLVMKCAVKPKKYLKLTAKAPQDKSLRWYSRALMAIKHPSLIIRKKSLG